MNNHYDTIVVGAGLAGLNAARTLHASGLKVVVLDKSKGVSGRAATRRWMGCVVDHGAQFFTTRSKQFKAQAAEWLSRGVCFEWCHGFSQVTDGVLHADSDPGGHIRYACADGMNMLGKDIAEGLEVRREILIGSISPCSSGWEVDSSNEETFTASRLVLALPVPQCLALFLASPFDIPDELETQLRTVQVNPSLCVVLKMNVPSAPLWKGVQCDDPVLSWIGNDSSKRPNPDGALVIVLHGSGDFSRKWMDENLEDAADCMVARASELTGLNFQRADRMIHRWRYAHVAQGVKSGCCLQSKPLPGLFITGDAFCGSKIEGAWLAGLQTAEQIIQG